MPRVPLKRTSCLRLQNGNSFSIAPHACQTSRVFFKKRGEMTPVSIGNQSNFKRLEVHDTQIDATWQISSRDHVSPFSWPKMGYFNPGGFGKRKSESLKTKVLTILFRNITFLPHLSDRNSRSAEST
jgi:hypothetical protein